MNGGCALGRKVMPTPITHTGEGEDTLGCGMPRRRRSVGLWRHSVVSVLVPPLSLLLSPLE